MEDESLRMGGIGGSHLVVRFGAMTTDFHDGFLRQNFQFPKPSVVSETTVAVRRTKTGTLAVKLPAFDL